MTRLSYGGHMPKDTFYNLPKNKQERIMEAIIDEFGRHTYEHINLSNIVRDSKIPRGSFYQYFLDKDDVFDHLNQEIQKLKYAYFGEIFNPTSEMTFFDRIEKLLTSSFGFAIKHPKITKIGQKLAESSFYRTHPMALQSIEKANQVFEDWIKKDVDKGLLRPNIDTHHVARLCVKLMNQPIYYENINQSSIDQHMQEIKVLIDLLKKGMENHV